MPRPGQPRVRDPQPTGHHRAWVRPFAPQRDQPVRRRALQRRKFVAREVMVAERLRRRGQQHLELLRGRLRLHRLRLHRLGLLFAAMRNQVPADVTGAFPRAKAEPLPAFRVLFVPGVTPTKWARIWNERMRRQRLELRPASSADAIAALRDGTGDAAFLRDVAPTRNSAPSGCMTSSRWWWHPVTICSRRSARMRRSAPTNWPPRICSTGRMPRRSNSWRPASASRHMPQSVARALSRRDVIARPLRDAAATTISLVWPLIEFTMPCRRRRVARPR